MTDHQAQIANGFHALYCNQSLRTWQDKPTVIVILDSDHTEAHVRAELDAYWRFVTPGSYLVVDDTNINGHPVLPGFGPGPMEAVRAFLATADEFVVDKSLERHFGTFNPNGWLRRRDEVNGVNRASD